jgi:hypothetical protein
MTDARLHLVAIGALLAASAGGLWLWRGWGLLVALDGPAWFCR